MAKGEHLIVTGIVQILLLVASSVLLLAAPVLSIFAGATGGRLTVAACEDLDRMLGEELKGTDAIDARSYTQLNSSLRSLRSGSCRDLESAGRLRDLTPSLSVNLISP